MVSKDAKRKTDTPASECNGSDKSNFLMMASSGRGWVTKGRGANGICVQLGWGLLVPHGGVWYWADLMLVLACCPPGLVFCFAPFYLPKRK